MCKGKSADISINVIYMQRFSKGNILHSLSISSTSKCKFKMKKQY